MKKNFPRSYNSLKHIFDFTSTFFAHHKLDSSLKFPVDLAIEEIFTNLVKYNPKSNFEISIELRTRNRDIIIQLIDRNTNLFDLTKTSEIDIRQPLEERKPGGLGIHFVKKNNG